MREHPTIVEASFDALSNALQDYYQISAKTWLNLKQICRHRILQPNQFWVHEGEVPHAFGFIHQGLMRAYITDMDGHEYNKIFFYENTFPGSMVALLANQPSRFSIQALEETFLIEINFQAYRHLLDLHNDLKWFHILYLEENWLIKKEQREVALVQDDAMQRYLDFQATYPELEPRLPQYHIASHLGITPTQLSRIRKKLAES